MSHSLRCLVYAHSQSTPQSCLIHLRLFCSLRSLLHLISLLLLLLLLLLVRRQLGPQHPSLDLTQVLTKSYSLTVQNGAEKWACVGTSNAAEP